jgi:hypothetical protein
MPATDDTQTVTRRKAVRRLGLVVVLLCVLLAGALIAFIVLWPRPGAPGFTGVAVTVPTCPAGAEGCRLLVVRISGGSTAGHDDWSGTGSTLNVVLPAGRYAVSEEGCTGDTIESQAISVSAGLHTAVDLGGLWELVGFVGRACPAFIPTASG